MNDEEILEVIREAVHLHVDPRARVEVHTRLIEDLGLDSISLLSLVVELEDRLQVSLAEGDEEGVVTVMDLVRLLRARGA